MLTTAHMHARKLKQTRFNTHRELIAYMHMCVHTRRPVSAISLTSLAGCCVCATARADERQEAGSVTGARALQAQQFTQQWSTKVGLH